MRSTKSARLETCRTGAAPPAELQHVSLETINVSSGDVIVLTADRVLDQKSEERLRRYVISRFPSIDVDVLLLHGGVALQCVLSPPRIEVLQRRMLEDAFALVVKTGAVNVS